MKFTRNECDLLEKVGEKVQEDIEYTKDEIQIFTKDIVEHIMSKSSKNGDIHKCAKEYDDLLFRFTRI